MKNSTLIVVLVFLLLFFGVACFWISILNMNPILTIPGALFICTSFILTALATLFCKDK